MSDESLQYRGVCIILNKEQPTDPALYKWEINPLWASRVAENFIQDFAGGIRITNPESDAYAALTAIALAFMTGDVEQARFGYDVSREAYGLVAQSIFAFGSGAGVKFDGSSEATARGRFVWEIRDNGHLSLKKY